MERFADDLMQRIQCRILTQINKIEFIDVSYASRIKLPPELFEECYGKIDTEKIKARIISRLEEETADKIVNKMMTEYANDIKQIMSNVELREELRGILRAKIKEAKAALE
jgi:argonaute-like protein implicated in RNA metabolism and viral defense